MAKLNNKFNVTFNAVRTIGKLEIEEVESTNTTVFYMHMKSEHIRYEQNRRVVIIFEEVYLRVKRWTFHLYTIQSYGRVHAFRFYMMFVSNYPILFVFLKFSSTLSPLRYDAARVGLVRHIHILSNSNILICMFTLS